MTVRFFVAGFVETDGLPSSLSADLFRRTLMLFAGGFLWKFGSSSSSPLVKGVPNVEHALLLGKGVKETLVDVVEISICSVAAFALYLVIVPTIRARLMPSGQVGKDIDSGLFAGRWTRRTKMSDVGWTETKFQFHLNATGKTRGLFFRQIPRYATGASINLLTRTADGMDGMGTRPVRWTDDSIRTTL
jgi:hypothetical protein